MDELSISGPSELAEVGTAGHLRRTHAGDGRPAHRAHSELRGGDAADNATILRASSPESGARGATSCCSTPPLCWSPPGSRAAVWSRPPARSHSPRPPSIPGRCAALLDRLATRAGTAKPASAYNPPTRRERPCPHTRTTRPSATSGLSGPIDGHDCFGAARLPHRPQLRCRPRHRGALAQSVFATFGAGLQTILGGNITLLTQLCEKTRQDAFAMMMQHAAEHGANAIIARGMTPMS